MDVDALARRSVELVREHQDPGGAYPAAPFPLAYRHCWFRDGAFVADAMSRTGEAASADAFFDWSAAVLEARTERIAAGERLNARYTVDGREVGDEWSEFQLDGYGTWLWALRAHGERWGRTTGPWARAVKLAREYLVRHWREPCFDWWEEREGIHAATLGAVAAGLAAWRDAEARAVERALRASLPRARVDASLLALVAPFRLCDPDAVLPLVEERLVSPGGGVHRHEEDTYYGGGEWLNATAWLGSARAAAGRRDDARAALEWVAAHAEADGALPEQADDHLLAPERRDEWVERWGLPASPLLWSHAAFIVLRLEVGAP